MSQPDLNPTERMRELIGFLNSRPWTDQERADVCASMVAAFVLDLEGRRATKTWDLEMTVKGVRTKLQVTVVCDPHLDQVAKG